MHGSGTAAGALVIFVIVCLGRPQETRQSQLLSLKLANLIQRTNRGRDMLPGAPSAVAV
jgi:hypothetical protein